MLRHWKEEDKKQWDTKVATSPDGGLLQSWAWGEFQEALGNAVYNLSDDKQQWFAQCLLLKAGNHWIMSIPRGPVFIAGGPNKQSFLVFMKQIKKFAEEQQAFLVRFDPPWPASSLSILNSSFFKKSLKELQPVHTLILDTSKSEEELLAGMKSKWRYNIRLAEKRGVTIRWGESEKDAEIFSDLMKKTTGRQDFISYNAEYFKTLIRTLAPASQGAFLFAEYKGEVIAGLLVGFFGGMASYLHGASDYDRRALMAPHYLQWEAIKEAKQRSVNYDFWGVATDPPSNKQEEHWKGVTRFKSGFATTTEITEYPGAYDMPVKKFWYQLYLLRQMLKR